MRDSPRTRRLHSDLRAITELKSNSSIFDFEVKGSPPDRYILKFHGKGLYRRESDRQIVVSNTHVVLIRLGSQYPRLIPEMKWKSPIFHPNIATNGAICLGGYTKHWVPSLGLAELCNMLWDMIRFANYDVASPYNRESANWTAMQKSHRFPIDKRPLRDLAVRKESPEGIELLSQETEIPILSGSDEIDNGILLTSEDVIEEENDHHSTVIVTDESFEESNFVSPPAPETVHAETEYSVAAVSRDSSSGNTSNATTLNSFSSGGATSDSVDQGIVFLDDDSSSDDSSMNGDDEDDDLFYID